SVLVFTALALGTLLLFRGPFAVGLTGAELWERVDLLTSTVMVGMLSYLSERFRSRAEQERDEARHEVLQLAREQAARREAARARARLLRLQAMQVDIGVALSSPGPLQGSLQRCCEAAVRHLDVAFARIWVMNDADDTLVLQASAGRYTHLGGTHARIKVGQFKIGAIAQERQAYQTNDVPNDPRISDPAWARREGMVAFAGHPLLMGERLIGVLAMFSTQPLPEETLATLGTVADTLAQGIERKRAEEALALRAEELARSNVELARSNADLARSNADLQQFAYVASHDLQEPLRMVASYTQLLARRYQGRLDSDADEFIGFVVDGATRMKRLIQDLLEFSRVGTRGRDPRAVNATEVLARTLKDLAANPLSGGAEVSHDPLPVIRADDLQLGQVFQNLLGNALKFRRPGVPPRIHVSARREGGHWVFSVRDNGIGIESQYFDRIFVLFQRLHTSAEYPGTGIGLAVCKKIVERHGGRIHVESVPGQGSTFFFTLPASAAEERGSAASAR
ncbi:MAG TPA: ATP-binding protein, partial [Longimicrobium sp.]|nr:ATP-binding protein [Longimicrobium sp.]